MLARDSTIETLTVDSYAYAASIFAKVVADGYIAMVKTVPFVYGYFYDRVERATHVPAARRLVNRYTATNLRKLTRDYRPDLVVCTHAFPCGVMSEYKRRFDASLPVVGIVTDFVAHPFWVYDNVDAYAVATQDMSAALVARGVPESRVIVSGIPVDSRFAGATESQDDVRRRLDLPRDRPIVLVMGGGVGIGPLDSIMRALAKIDTSLCAVVIVGRNARLERRVIAAAEHVPYPVRAFGFVDNVYDFMRASDVLISKPGGLTMSEALAARVPTVLVRPLPGPEERNTTYLVSHGAAAHPPGGASLAAAVSRLLVSPEHRAATVRQIEQLRRPQAAADIADRILELIAERVARHGAPSGDEPDGRPA